MVKKTMYLSALVACMTVGNSAAFVHPGVALGLLAMGPLPGAAMLGVSALLTPVSATLYGIGKYCYLKSGAPAYIVNHNPLNFDMNSHENYPTDFHGKSSDATEKQKVLSRCAYRCLRTGSMISMPV